jgi:glycosyltransferase involved in cell wall biosynthesis
MQTAEDGNRNRWCSAAHNTTQLELMDALHDYGHVTVTGLSLPSTSAYRTRPRAWKGKRTVLREGVVIEELPFYSLGPLQVATQTWSLTRRLLGAWGEGRPDAILLANPLVRFTLPSLLAGWLWNVPVVSIVADLTPPQTGQPLVERLRAWLRTLMVRLTPGTVMFSSHTATDYRGHKPSMRMVRPPASFLLDLPQPPGEPATKAVYYAGALVDIAGVDLLLDAIPHVTDRDVEFWISGRGPLEERVKQAAATDPRVRFFGFVTQEKYAELLQEAAVLVNPRPRVLLENRYNFPSKLMEYLAAGRPVISTATSDVAEHYGDAVVVLDDETPEGLARCIEQVFATPVAERAAMGSRARAAVEGVTWRSQAEPILAFIRSLEAGPSPRP